MVAKLTRLTQKIAIQLHPVAESYTICSFRSRRTVRKLFDTPSYTYYVIWDDTVRFILVTSSFKVQKKNLKRDHIVSNSSSNITHPRGYF